MPRAHYLEMSSPEHEVNSVARNIANATRVPQCASTTTAVSIERRLCNENRTSIRQVSRAMVSRFGLQEHSSSPEPGR